MAEKAELAAVFSPDRQYRYVLRRTIGLGDGRCLFIMLNPSTADETQNDPTIRRCMGFARDWGYGTLEVCNLFALRSTDPKALYQADDPVGPLNDATIMYTAQRANRIVLAWGVHGGFQDRGDQVRVALDRNGFEAVCLGMTLSGEPKHPLFLPRSTPPMPVPSVIR